MSDDGQLVCCHERWCVLGVDRLSNADGGNEASRRVRGGLSAVHATGGPVRAKVATKAQQSVKASLRQGRPIFWGMTNRFCISLGVHFNVKVERPSTVPHSFGMSNPAGDKALCFANGSHQVEFVRQP